jgi:hypothetical protein
MILCRLKSLDISFLQAALFPGTARRVLDVSVSALFDKVDDDDNKDLMLRVIDSVQSYV